MVVVYLSNPFDDDPFLILAWRGRGKDELLDHLRALRGAATPEVAPDLDRPGDPDPGSVPPVEAQPLRECLDRFWSAGDLTGLRIRPRAAEIPDALLRPLDPAPVDLGGHALTDLLAPAYRTLTAGAARRALDGA